MLNIAIFMPYVGLYTNTKVLCFTESLAGKGVSVDLYLLNHACKEYGPESKLHSNINLVDLGEGLVPAAGARSTFGDFVPPQTLTTVDALAATKFYDYAIGIHAPGLLYAHYLAEQTGCPYAYMSQKLHRIGNPGCWTNNEIAALKDLEREYLPDADMFIIQDFEREESYFENIGIEKHPNIMHFPAAVIDFSLPPETRFWHDKFDLPVETRVILSIGSFNRHNIKADLIENCKYLPDDQVLVLHGRFDEELEQDLMDPELNGKIYISKELLEWRKVPILVASADIGLASFYEFNINQYLAGRASTSIAYFAKCGIPMICPNFGTFRDVTSQFHNGVCVSNPNQFIMAVDSLLSNYLHYSSGARDAFDDLYNVDIYAEQLWEYIRDQKNKSYMAQEPAAAEADMALAAKYSVASLLSRD